MKSANAGFEEDLQIGLELSRRPVGVRFLYTQEQYEAVDVPQLKQGVSYCNMVRMAGLGRGFKTGREQSACMGGSLGTGLAPMNSYKSTGSSYSRENLALYETVGTARSVVADMLFMEPYVRGLELRPLGEFETHNPDVVIIMAKPYAVMRLVQGYTFHHGMKKDFRLCGNHALCSELTAVPFLTNDINISVLCSGTRYRCNWGDETMGMGIAYARLRLVVEGLLATLADTEPQAKKDAVQERAARYGREADVRPGREYFRRKLKTDW